MLFSVHPLHQPEEEAQLIEVKFLVHDIDWLFCFGFIFPQSLLQPLQNLQQKTDIANKPIEITETTCSRLVLTTCEICLFDLICLVTLLNFQQYSLSVVYV